MSASILIIIGLFAAGLLILILMKIRRIHLATFRLVDMAESTNRETRTLYRQIQAHSELSRMLDFPMSLPLLRGWAASPDLLLEVARHILAEKPRMALECSSGSSTLVAARCMQILGEGKVFSLEHDPHYAQATRHELARQGLEKWATVIDAPLEKIGNQSLWYCLSKLPPEVKDVDLMVIDGPPQSTCSLARYPAIPQLKKFLATGATIFLDDADRQDEQEAVKRWLVENPGWTHTQLFCEKGCARIQTNG